MEIKQLAQVLTDASHIHEESYDHEAADEAEKAWEVTHKPPPIIDFTKFYTKTKEEACIEACKKNDLPKEMARFIDLALYWSNDIMDWCEAQGVFYPKREGGKKE